MTRRESWVRRHPWETAVYVLAAVLLALGLLLGAGDTEGTPVPPAAPATVTPAQAPHAGFPGAEEVGR